MKANMLLDNILLILYNKGHKKSYGSFWKKYIS